MATMRTPSERALQAMDPFGRRAMDYARQHCPRQYAAIPDPVSFFTNLGEEMRAQVTAAEEALAHAPGGPDPTTPEGWRQRLGQANMARLMIEERVFSEMVYEAMPPEEDPEDEEIDQYPGWHEMLEDLAEISRGASEDIHL